MNAEVYAMYGGWSYLPDYPTIADLDRGEIFKLVDQSNDDVLMNLKYVIPVEKGAKKYQCDMCSRQFINSITYHAHKKKVDCMDSQKNTASGLRKSDVAQMLDVDPSKLKIENVPEYQVDVNPDLRLG